MGALEVLLSAGGSGLSRHDRVIEAELLGRPVLPRPVEKALTTAVATQYAKGIVGVARVEAVRTVAGHALRALDSLEHEERAAVLRDPMNGGRRQRMIVDTAAMAMGEAVRVTGQVY